MRFNLLFVSGFLLLMTGCPIGSSVTSAPHDPLSHVSPTPPTVEKPVVGPTPNQQIMTSEMVRCSRVVYDLQNVNNISRQADDVRLVKPDGPITNNINMPSVNLFQGFALNWAKKIPGGFQISIEWGTRIYHEMRFDFVCKRSGFFLTKIRHENFDKHFPEDSKRYRVRTVRVKPNLPLEKFVITDYMVD